MADNQEFPVPVAHGLHGFRKGSRRGPAWAEEDDFDVTRMLEIVHNAQEPAVEEPGYQWFELRTVLGDTSVRKDITTLRAEVAGLRAELRRLVARVDQVHGKAGDVTATFRKLAATWKHESRGPSSFLSHRFMHTAYQRIIGLGLAAVPLILKELAEEPDHWGWALTAITGENPIEPEDAGDIDAIAAAWLKWGREHGLVDVPGRS